MYNFIFGNKKVEIQDSKKINALETLKYNNITPDELIKYLLKSVKLTTIKYLNKFDIEFIYTVINNNLYVIDKNDYIKIA